MKKAKLLGRALICVFAVIYSACDNPADKLPKVGIRDNTGNLGEYSERLTAYKTDIEKISQEIFGDVIIGSKEYLFNLDESPDFIYVDFTNYGYAVFAAESLELMEFAALGSLPYQNTRGRRQIW
jgi:cyanate lyase